MKKYFPLVIITLFTFLIWKPVLGQTLLGEGSIYFSHPYLEILDHNLFQVLLSRHDTQALIFFGLTRDIFRDNFKFYMWFLIFGASFVNVTTYYLVKKITKSTFASIISVTLLIANFAGSFEILGLGYYQWFIQRVPNFGLSFISLIFFIFYLQNKKRLYYYLSFLIYTLAVFLARYSIHILPLIIFCSFFWNLFNDKDLSLKNRSWIFISTSAPLVFVSFLLFKAQSLVPDNSNVNSINEIFAMIPTVFNQLSYLTLPFLKPVTKFMPFVMIGYLASGILVFLKNKSLRFFVLPLLISIPLSILLSIILNPIFITYFDTSRYLYYSSILVSIYWGISAWVIVRTRRALVFPIVVIVIGWVIYNKYVIDLNFNNWQDRHDRTYATFNYFRNNKQFIPPKSTILIPKEVGHYGAAMINYLYGNNGWNFILDDETQVKYNFYLRYNGVKSVERIGENTNVK